MFLTALSFKRQVHSSKPSVYTVHINTTYLATFPYHNKNKRLFLYDYQHASNSISSNIIFVFTDKPLVQIRTRPRYNFNKIKEGDNVTLECVVDANPAINAVQWYHNVSILFVLFSFIHFKIIDLFYEKSYS